MNRLLIYCATGFFFCFGCSAAFADCEDCEEPLGWGCPAPDFRLPSLNITDGSIADSISLSDYAGKVILLDFIGYT